MDFLGPGGQEEGPGLGPLFCPQGGPRSGGGHSGRQENGDGSLGGGPSSRAQGCSRSDLGVPGIWHRRLLGDPQGATQIHRWPHLQLPPSPHEGRVGFQGPSSAVLQGWHIIQYDSCLPFQDCRSVSERSQ